MGIFPKNKQLAVILAALFILQSAVFIPKLCAQSLPKDTLRGEVSVELEPMYLLHLGINSPLEIEEAITWALEDSAAAFSGMIYGWDFEYEAGERARGLQEALSLSPLGHLEFGDPRLKVSSASIREQVYYLWCDFQLSPEQQFRYTAWHASKTKSLKAMGYAPLQGPDGVTERAKIKKAALEDAMKKAIRAELRKNERNRPRKVLGSIALETFPLYRISHGNWAAQAQFRIHIKEIIPFSAY